MLKVLFIDDDIVLGSIVTNALVAKGFKILFQNTLSGAKGAITEFAPDAIVLDIALYAEDGVSFIPYIKDIAPQTPVIVASSHTDYHEIQRAFDAGASDFVKKPYVPEELSIYIRKNCTATSSHIIHIGTLFLDTGTRILSSETGELKRLSLFEYKLLKLLANNRGEVVPREAIETELWGTIDKTNEYSINNLINILRKLLSKDKSLMIDTFKGRGYMLL